MGHLEYEHIVLDDSKYSSKEFETLNCQIKYKSYRKENSLIIFEIKLSNLGGGDGMKLSERDFGLHLLEINISLFFVVVLYAKVSATNVFIYMR